MEEFFFFLHRYAVLPLFKEILYFYDKNFNSNFLLFNMGKNIFSTMDVNTGIYTAHLREMGEGVCCPSRARGSARRLYRKLTYSIQECEVRFKWLLPGYGACSSAQVRDDTQQCIKDLMHEK